MNIFPKIITSNNIYKRIRHFYFIGWIHHCIHKYVVNSRFMVRRDAWDLRSHAAEFMLPRLHAMYPCSAHPGNMSPGEWDEILKTITNTFEMIAEDNIWSEEEEKIIKDGLELFSKWYLALWN